MTSSDRTIDPKALMSTLDEGEAVVLIDVRRKADYDADPQVIPNAAWKDPALVSQWSEELPKDKKVIVYCVRGGSVSNSVVDHLLAKEVKACYIQGGITAWKEQGGPLVKREETL
jgi:rhodanese-related sulfurtransferase